MQQWFGVGNLGRDPEKIETRSGKIMAKFSMAVDDGRDRDSLWFEVVAFNATAENVLRYLGKGSKVAVIGKIAIDDWEDKDGNKRRKYYVSAFQVKFLDSRDGGRKGGGSDSGRSQSRESDNWNMDEEEDPFGDN